MNPFIWAIYRWSAASLFRAFHAFASMRIHALEFSCLINLLLICRVFNLIFHAFAFKTFSVLESPGLIDLSLICNSFLLDFRCISVHVYYCTFESTCLINLSLICNVFILSFTCSCIYNNSRVLIILFDQITTDLQLVCFKLSLCLHSQQLRCLNPLVWTIYRWSTASFF